VKKYKRVSAYIFILINIVCWGVALPIVKPALSVTTPFRYLLYRFILAGFLSLPFIFHYWPQIQKKAKTIAIIFGVELVGTTLSLSLLYFGLRLTTSVEANLIGSGAPLFLTLMSIIFLHEREEKHEWIGLFLAFLSTALIVILPIFSQGKFPGSFSFLGNMFIIVHNITSSLYFLLAKKYYHNLPKVFATSISYIVGIITFFFLSIFEAGSSLHTFSMGIQKDVHSPTVWFATVYMATFGSIIALTCYMIGQDRIEASEASMLSYLQPLISLPVAMLFLGEKVQPVQVLLLCIVLVGVYISEKRTKKVRKKLVKTIKDAQAAFS